MVCPNCKSNDIKAVTSIGTNDEFVCRRRQCKVCKYTFRTIEMLVDGNEALSNAFAKCERTHRAPYYNKNYRKKEI